MLRLALLRGVMVLRIGAFEYDDLFGFATRVLPPGFGLILSSLCCFGVSMARFHRTHNIRLQRREAGGVITPKNARWLLCRRAHI